VFHILFTLALALAQVNLDNHCRDAMKMNLNGDDDGEVNRKVQLEVNMDRTWLWSTNFYTLLLSI